MSAGSVEDQDRSAHHRHLSVGVRRREHGEAVGVVARREPRRRSGRRRRLSALRRRASGRARQQRRGRRRRRHVQADAAAMARRAATATMAPADRRRRSAARRRRCAADAAAWSGGASNGAGNNGGAAGDGGGAVYIIAGTSIALSGNNQIDVAVRAACGGDTHAGGVRRGRGRHDRPGLPCSRSRFDNEFRADRRWRRRWRRRRRPPRAATDGADPDDPTVAADGAHRQRRTAAMGMAALGEMGSGRAMAHIDTERAAVAAVVAVGVSSPPHPATIGDEERYRHAAGLSPDVARDPRGRSFPYQVRSPFLGDRTDPARGLRIRSGGRTVRA